MRRCTDSEHERSSDDFSSRIGIAATSANIFPRIPRGSGPIPPNVPATLPSHRPRCRHQIVVKPAHGVRKLSTETTTALTARGHSPEKRRMWANSRHAGRPGRSTTTLRRRKQRTGLSGNVCRNWGYAAILRQGDGVNQRVAGVRRGKIWLLG
jgi:hypothetical protein